MERIELGLNIKQIAQSQYVIPLYQRNFAWEENEINQLLSDIYENFSNDSSSNYFVGSLVVFKRNGNNDYWEVIDGQQRLTVLSLIIKRLAGDKFKETFLSYDSREEVSDFLQTFYAEGIGAVKKKTIVDETRNLHNALDYIESADLTIKDVDKVTLIRDLSKEDLADFTDYILHKVILVRVEMPDDTDVANYFEVMNNRGEQLQKHEILKSQLMSKLNEKDQPRFALIWDACSQMERRIQRNFNPTNRNAIFGDDYSNINLKAVLTIDEEKSCEDDIDYIIENYSAKKDPKEKKEEDEEVTENSIIDFPNFLMHIFRLCYNEEYALFTKKEGDKVPLNDKFLLDVYNKISKKIDPIKFSEQLLFYRTVFDKFIIKSASDDSNDVLNDETNSRWTLLKPSKQKDKGSVVFSNTFKDIQQLAVKVLSMFQVTYRTRIYKEYLAEILSWFNPEDETITMGGKDYLIKLNNLALKYYERVAQNEWTDKSGEQKVGVAVPHFVFNFIDYLYWFAWKNNTEGIENLNLVEEFDFSYTNSVEHHLPQSFEGDHSYEIINCLGNLCLISKGLNSKLSDLPPLAKSSDRFYKKGLNPKRKIMYDITNAKKKWSDNEIEEHDKNVRALLDKRAEILSKIEIPIDLSDTDALRALMCFGDISKEIGSSNIGTKYTFKDENYIVTTEAYRKLKEWKKANPFTEYKDFIEEQLSTNEFLIAGMRDSFNKNLAAQRRYLFIKYPCIINYCRNGCFTIKKDENDENVFLLRKNKPTEVKDSFLSLENSHYINLWLLLLTHKLIDESNEFFCTNEKDTLYIGFDKKGITNNPWSLKNNLVLSIYDTFEYEIRTWEDEKQYNWLTEHGWKEYKDGSKTLYFEEIGLNIQTDETDVDAELESGVKNVLTLIENIKKYWNRD